MIGLRTATALRPHRVTLSNPGPPVPDGDGGYTQGATPLNPPALYVSIESPAGGQDERLAPGTVVSSFTRLVTGQYHPQVTTATTIDFNGRKLQVVGKVNIQERNQEMVLTCEEREAAPTP